MVFKDVPDLKREPMRQVVYEYLKKAIIKGQLKPEATFKDQDIAEEFGISRTPVREAIQRLEAEGYVERIPMRGNRVIRLSPFELAHTYSIRKNIESLAVKYVALRINGEEIESLTDLMKKCELIFKDYSGEKLYQQYLPIINQYNRIMFGACRSEHLQELIWSQREIIDRFRIMRITILPRIHESFSNRKKMLRAFKEHDPATASEVWGKHIEASFMIWLEKSGFKEELKNFRLL